MYLKLKKLISFNYIFNFADSLIEQILNKMAS